ncbi:cupin domain-containing protein [Paraburkholderia sediminicola]|uniref:JmjC domain-containing protein n=1 Tax=Paraburkholderia sediminicola TaxID=458836 RepID=UPI0038BB5899
MDLSALLGSLPIDDFLGRYWGQRELHGECASPGQFCDLGQALDLETTVWRERGAWGDLRLARAGTSPADCQYLLAPASIETLAAAMDDGYTIVVNNYQVKSAVVAQLCRAMEKAFFARCTVNLYFTGPGCKGLDAHYDDTDVFVLQIVGQKTWHIREGGRVLPMEGEAYRSPRGDEAVRSTYELKAGDFLYIPRGFIHEAHTTVLESTHLTISVSTIRWVTLFERVIRMLAETDAAFREDIWPPRVNRVRGTMNDVPQGLATRMAESLVDGTLIAAAISDLRAECIAGLDRLPKAGRLRAPEARVISGGSVMRHAHDQLCDLDERSGKLVLRFIGGTMSFDADLTESIRFVVERDIFRVDDIPGELDLVQKIGLTRRLVEVGLIDHACDGSAAASSGASDFSLMG